MPSKKTDPKKAKLGLKLWEKLRKSAKPNDESKPVLRFWHKFKVPSRPKLHLKSILLFVLFLLFVGIGVIGAGWLKHRQLCDINQLKSNEYISAPDNVDLCPNILDQNQWGQILSNLFNFELMSKITAKEIDYTVSAKIEDCSDKLNPLCWIRGSKPSLKETDGYTNLLLVGLDTRPGGRLKNTDSIMLVTLDNTSGRILLTSFPRDLYVYYNNPRGGYVNSKINAIYANYGIDGLRYAIEQINGRKVHYHAFIYFGTFITLVDKLGGVDINLPEKFSDAYPCSDLPAGYKCPSPRFISDGQYGLFNFPAGWNHFGSTEALVYARSRKYSSDYERARRQQQILKAILDSALKQNVPITQRLQNYIEMYNLIQTDVLTDIGIADIAAVVSIMDQLSGNVARIVVDPSLGGFGKIIGYEGRDPAFKDRKYKQFQNYVANIWKFLPYFVDQPKILVVNASGAPIPADSALSKYLNSGNPYWQVKHVDKTMDVSGIKLYDLSKGAKTGSLKDAQEQMPGSLIYSAEIDGITQSDFVEDYQIVWGKQETTTE